MDHTPGLHQVNHALQYLSEGSSHHHENIPTQTSPRAFPSPSRGDGLRPRRINENEIGNKQERGNFNSSEDIQAAVEQFTKQLLGIFHADKADSVSPKEEVFGGSEVAEGAAIPDEKALTAGIGVGNATDNSALRRLDDSMTKVDSSMANVADVLAELNRYDNKAPEKDNQADGNSVQDTDLYKEMTTDLECGDVKIEVTAADRGTGRKVLLPSAEALFKAVEACPAIPWDTHLREMCGQIVDVMDVCHHDGTTRVSFQRHTGGRMKAWVPTACLVETEES